MKFRYETIIKFALITNALSKAQSENFIKKEAKIIEHVLNIDFQYRPAKRSVTL